MTNYLLNDHLRCSDGSDLGNAWGRNIYLSLVKCGGPSGQVPSYRTGQLVYMWLLCWFNGRWFVFSSLELESYVTQLKLLFSLAQCTENVLCVKYPVCGKGCVTKSADFKMLQSASCFIILVRFIGENWVNSVLVEQGGGTVFYILRPSPSPPPTTTWGFTNPVNKSD